MDFTFAKRSLISEPNLGEPEMAIVPIVSTEFHRDGVITNSTRPSRVLLNLSDLTAIKAFKNEVWW